MTHGWKAMNHTLLLDQKERVYMSSYSQNNLIITVHWNVGKIIDLILFLHNSYFFISQKHISFSNNKRGEAITLKEEKTAVCISKEHLVVSISCIFWGMLEEEKKYQHWMFLIFSFNSKRLFSIF